MDFCTFYIFFPALFMSQKYSSMPPFCIDGCLILPLLRLCSNSIGLLASRVLFRMCFFRTHVSAPLKHYCIHYSPFYCLNGEATLVVLVYFALSTTWARKTWLIGGMYTVGKVALTYANVITQIYVLAYVEWVYRTGISCSLELGPMLASAGPISYQHQICAEYSWWRRWKHSHTRAVAWVFARCQQCYISMLFAVTPSLVFVAPWYSLCAHYLSMKRGYFLDICNL